MILPPRALIDGYAGVLSPRSCIYVGGPITTGERYLTWVGEGRVSSFQRTVIDPNCEDLSSFAARLRNSRDRVPVVDPSELKIPQWTQAHYHEFWIEFVNRFVRMVYLLDGWSYSLGAVLEFETAIRLGLPVTDSNEGVLQLHAGRDLIKAAAADERVPRELRAKLSEVQQRLSGLV